MRYISFIIILSLIFAVIPVRALSSDNDELDTLWETYGLNLGIFISDLNTSFRVGSGIGLDVDAEKLLGLDSTNSVFRIGGLWRFSDNKRHRLDFSWFAFHRSGSKSITQDIQIEKRDGNTIIIPADTDVDSFFDIDIYQGAYSYSFLQDDRIDLAAIFGIYVMPIDFGIKASGFVSEEGQQDFIAPLPTVGLRLDIALAPKWFLRSGTQVFYLEYEQYKGSLLTFYGAIEYKPWKHIGFGLGLDSFKIRAEADGEDYPLIDFRGNIEFDYFGVQFYTRLFF